MHKLVSHGGGVLLGWRCLVARLLRSADKDSVNCLVTLAFEVGKVICGSHGKIKT